MNSFARAPQRHGPVGVADTLCDELCIERISQVAGIPLTASAESAQGSVTSQQTDFGDAALAVALLNEWLA